MIAHLPTLNYRLARRPREEQRLQKMMQYLMSGNTAVFFEHMYHNERSPVSHFKNLQGKGSDWVKVDVPALWLQKVAKNDAPFFGAPYGVKDSL